MSNKKKLVPENLDEEQVRTLNEILNLIIPPSKNRRMPGAANVGFLTYLQIENNTQWIQEGLIKIIEESHKKYENEFSALSSSIKTQLINDLKRKFRQFFNHLTILVMQCYYQHDDVLVAIGQEGRPPFPEGYHVLEGDLILLEPVYLRGKVYRE
jgi:hypothetical protein